MQPDFIVKSIMCIVLLIFAVTEETRVEVIFDHLLSSSSVSAATAAASTATATAAAAATTMAYSFSSSEGYSYFQSSLYRISKSTSKYCHRQ
mmetsp:Transcript_20285/g.20697  ORF Transcript_20285/g.20697 Transcript_20285/m.20697 type:complete len:92 (+) Transcript_20285:271-546(+)